MPILLPIAFGLLGALFVEGMEGEEAFGATATPSPLPPGSKTRFKPLWRKKRRKRRRRRAQAIADAHQTSGEEAEDPLRGEDEETEDPGEAIDPYEAASHQIDVELAIEQISEEIASDMFGSLRHPGLAEFTTPTADNDRFRRGRFGGKHHGHKIGWPHTYHRGQRG